MSTPTTWNPGEPVFDQATGNPYVDADGNLIECAPGLIISAADGRSLDGDDVANAAWLRANIYEGECTRDTSVGVPYLRLALGQQDQSLALSVVVAEVDKRTPGVAGVVDAVGLGLDPLTRVFRFQATLIKQGGGEQSFDATTGG
jgi:hypothetical protein